MRIALVVPGSIAQRSGGYEYDRRIAAGLRARGWTVDVEELDGAFPRPSAAALAGAAHALSRIPDGTIVVIDGLAFGAMPAEAERERTRLRLVALIHLPLAAHVGINPDEAARFHESERRALAAACGCVVTGTTTVPMLETYGVAPEAIAVVEPGTDRAPLARGSGDPVHLVSVAAVTRGKGHDVLIRALGRLRNRSWHLTCAGSVDREPAATAQLRELIQAERLEQQVSFVGEVDESALAALYDRADVFVHPSLYETYGMVVAEALARGLPVVATPTGAIRDLIGSDAGLLVPPADVGAMSDALARVVDDPELRGRLAAGARRVRDHLPTWDDTVDRMAAVLERFRACPPKRVVRRWT